MTQITIPVDPVFVVLEIPRQTEEDREVSYGRYSRTHRVRVTRIETIENGWSRQGVRDAVDGANRIWEAGQIRFLLMPARTRRFRPPGNVERIDDDTFQYLINQMQGQPGRITMLLVHRFSQWDLGGRASRGTCILPSNLVPRYRPGVFAHEFGHLLGLPHDETTVNGVINVMQQGYASELALTEGQIETARDSNLATRALAAQEAGIQALNTAGPAD